MKNAPLFRYAAMLSLAMLLGTSGVHAQSRSTDAARFTVHVSELTAATRDAVARDLTAGGNTRLVFSCVPAGLLVFESLNPASREQVRERALPLLQQRSGAALITEIPIGLREAEAECAQTRDR
ncbi:MAG: hypothetical protein ABI432_06620 [Flavobacteriales bacterium]